MPSNNPAHRVCQAFERIQAERMAGLPLLNEALRVELVGFLDWGDRHVGVLITPWCVNLMVLPQSNSDWRPPEEGVWRYECFPGMELQLLGGQEPDIGIYAFRSLLSPVTGYDNQDSVRAVAREVLKQLLSTPGPDADAAPSTAVDGLIPEVAPRKVSRRRILGGE
jgi:[NiFe] hydrogenase assembly HybE family chaperone